MIMNEPKRFHIEPFSWLQRTLKVTLLRFYIELFLLRVHGKEKLAEFPFLSLKVFKTFKFFFFNNSGHSNSQALISYNASATALIKAIH